MLQDSSGGELKGAAVLPGLCAALLEFLSHWMEAAPSKPKLAFLTRRFKTKGEGC